MNDFRHSAAQLDMHQFVRIVQLGSVTGQMPAFRAANSLAFPVSDIAGIMNRDDREQIEFTCLGLHGVSSPLPHYFITDALDDENASLREFLGIFNQQIYRAYFRAWEQKHPHLFSDSALLGQDMLSSLACETFDQIQTIPGLIELFLNEQRSTHELRELITALFPEQPFEIKMETVEWIEVHVPAYLGSVTTRLNDGLTVGKRIPLYSHQLTLEIGPCSMKTIQSNHDFHSLIRYLHHALSINILWKILPDEGSTTLGAGASLGWNSTLGKGRSEMLKVQHVYQPG